MFCGYTRRDRANAWCFDLHTGEQQWSVTECDSPLEGGFKNYGDPILADGKIFGVVNKKVSLFRPDPAGIHYVGQTSPIDAADTSAPAVANGRMYVLCYSRGGTARVTCLDIAAPPDAKPAITQTRLPDREFGQWYHRRLWCSSGNGERSWCIAEGRLPHGMDLKAEFRATLESNCRKSSTPDRIRTYNPRFRRSRFHDLQHALVCATSCYRNAA